MAAVSVVRMPPSTKFIELKKVLDTLHGPKGCLWDKSQTHRALLPHFREEVEEFITAVKNDDNGHIWQ